MLFSVGSRRLAVAGLVTPFLAISLVACGQGDSQADSVSATSVSASPSATASVEPSATATGEPTPEETGEETAEPAPEEAEESYLANLDFSPEENAALYASAEELAAINAAREQAIIDNGWDPNEDYVKYGAILCHGEAFPTTEDLQSHNASQAFIDWYTQYVAEAPQYVLDMSEGNKAADHGYAAPAIDSAKCSEYGQL